MKQRLINAALFVTFLFCLIEWGGGHSYFLFQMEYEFFTQINEKLGSFTHPLILLPFCGQLLLLVTFLQKQPSRKLSMAGLLLTVPLAFMILLAGIFSLNYKMIISVMPYTIAAVYFIIIYRAGRTIQNKPQ